MTDPAVLRLAGAGDALAVADLYIGTRREHVAFAPLAHTGAEVRRWVGDVLLPSPVQLWTFQVNAGSRRFYERRGFACVELTDGSRNEERCPDARYVRTLPG